MTEPTDTDIRKLVRRLEANVLPVLHGDRIALIELGATLISGANQLPEVRGRIARKNREAALALIDGLLDWRAVNPAILGYLYESLLEARDDRTKQGPRRKGGVFYTPGHITDYLVKAAIGSCKSVERNRLPGIMDPACGGGAFLLAALRELRRRYPDKRARDIALDCLFGIDSDENAVHVARLSLWIEAGLSKKDWGLLKRNVRSGDPLREFADGSDEMFDIVVGNPPYRNVKRGIPVSLKKFCKRHYRSATGQWDLAAPFVEMTITRLLHDGGSCGFIVPNPLLLAENYQPLREIILENTLIEFGPAGRPFDDPAVEASLLVARSGKSRRASATVLDGTGDGRIGTRSRKLPVSLLKRLPFNVFSHLADPDFRLSVLDSLDAGRLRPLGDLVTITRGIECGKKDRRVVESKGGFGKSTRPLIIGETVREYFARPSRWFVLDESSRRGGIMKNESLWTGERQLLLRRVASRPIAAVAAPPSLVLNTLYVVGGDDIDEYATCALLNSAFFRELFRQMFAFDDTLFPYLRVSQLSQIPVPPNALTDSMLSKWSQSIHEIASDGDILSESKHAVHLIGKIDQKVEEMYGGRGVTGRKQPQQRLRPCRRP